MNINPKETFKLWMGSPYFSEASHNPPEYNGYKVYWEDGGQITPPRDRDIIEEVNAVTDLTKVKPCGRAIFP